MMNRFPIIGFLLITPILLNPAMAKDPAGAAKPEFHPFTRVEISGYPFFKAGSAQPVLIDKPIQVQPNWGVEQATGKPNTPQPGDHHTAWATLEPDAGQEWIELTFAAEISIAEIRIVETYNPGAVVKIVAADAAGDPVVLWEGDSSTSEPMRTLRLWPQWSTAADRIAIHLDTARVPGWNEIDAVALIDREGVAHWAVSARASSSYAEPRRNGGLDTIVNPFSTPDAQFDAAPPVVIMTDPPAGSTDVDPGLKQLIVVFSKDMAEPPQIHVGDEVEAVPPAPFTGSRWLEDRRTLVLDVELEPAKIYMLWLRNDRPVLLRDTNDKPLIPYLLTFKTADAAE